MDRLATLIAAGMLAIGLAVGVQVARRFPGFAGGHWIWGWNSLLLGGIAYGIVDLGVAEAIYPALMFTGLFAPLMLCGAYSFARRPRFAHLVHLPMSQSPRAVPSADDGGAS